MSSTALSTILIDLVREYDLGRYGVTTATGTTTTLVDAVRFKRPSSGNEFNRNTPVRILSRAAVAGGAITIGSNSFVDDFDPSTGTVTVSPAFDDTAEIGAGFIILHPNTVDHSDRLLEAINRFLTRVAERRMRVPLTYVPNGDYLASLPTTGWTGTNTTLAYVELAHPDGWYPRVLRVTASSSSARATSTTLKAVAGESWNIATDMYVGAAGDIASLVIQDETAGAAITPTYSKGAATTSSLSPVETVAHFTIPTGCTQISIRLSVGVSGDIGYFGPVVAAPANATLYTGQTWLEYLKRVEGLWTYAAGATSPSSRTWNRVEWGRHDDQLGWGQGFSFESTPPFPLWADCLLGYAPLAGGDPTAAASGSAASESDTTACPEPLLLKGAAIELFRMMQTAERRRLGDDKASTKWDGQLADAEEAMVTAQSDWNAPKKISVRKHFAGKASA